MEARKTNNPLYLWDLKLTIFTDIFLWFLWLQWRAVFPPFGE